MVNVITVNGLYCVSVKWCRWCTTCIPHYYIIKLIRVIAILLVEQFYNLISGSINNAITFSVMRDDMINSHAPWPANGARLS